MPNTWDVRYITNGWKLLTSTLWYLPSQYKKVTWNWSWWIDNQWNNVTVNWRWVDNNTWDLITENNTGVNVDTNTGTNVDTNIDTDTNTEVKKPVKASDIVKIPETRRLPTKNTRRKFVPTYVAPDWKTYTGMTQDQFNQRMQEYQMENDAYKKQQDNQLQDLYTRALDKYIKEPDSFTEAQKQALVNTAKKLWHLDSLLPSIVTWENMTNITSSTPTVTTTNTQASSLPTVNQVTNQDSNASNYWGRYAWSEAWSEETRKSQWASNAASFWL